MLAFLSVAFVGALVQASSCDSDSAKCNTEHIVAENWLLQISKLMRTSVDKDDEMLDIMTIAGMDDEPLDMIVLGGRSSDEMPPINNTMTADAVAENRMRYRRPEWQKAYRCHNQDAASCEECWDETNCWTGDWYKASRVISVEGTPESEQWARYINEVHIECSAEILYMAFKAWEVTSGVVHHYFNDLEITEDNGFNVSLSGTAERISPITQPCHRRAFVTIPLAHSGGNFLKTEFVPQIDQSQHKVGEARISVTIFVDSVFRTCEDSKVCLASLGKGTANAKKLRGSNAEQYRCLTADFRTSGEEVSWVCKKWRRCLQKVEGMEQQLRALLSSGLGPQVLEVGALPPQRPVLQPLVPDAMPSKLPSELPRSPLCINPAEEDPESWACDCFQGMAYTCSQCENQGGMDEEGYPKPACLQLIYCQDDRVCDFWKNANCDTTTANDGNLGTCVNQALLNRRDGGGDQKANVAGGFNAAMARSAKSC